MKKLTLLGIALLTAGMFCHAQFSKGAVILGGGISGYKNKSDDGTQESNHSDVTIYPAIGIAVDSNTVVGVRFYYTTRKLKQPNPMYTFLDENKGYGTGLFYRKYFRLGKSFYLFGDGAVAYNYNEQKTDNGDLHPKRVYKSNSIGINLYPGVAYAASRRFQFEISLNRLLNFEYTKGRLESTFQNQTTTEKISRFNFSTNVNPTSSLDIGFRIVLGNETR